MDGVCFASRRRGVIFARRAAVAKRLKRLYVNRDACRQAVQRAPDSGRVRLAENAQVNAISEGRRHALLLNERYIAAQKSVVIKEIGIGFVNRLGSVDEYLRSAA